MGESQSHLGSSTNTECDLCDSFIILTEQKNN